MSLRWASHCCCLWFARRSLALVSFCWALRNVHLAVLLLLGAGCLWGGWSSGLTAKSVADFEQKPEKLRLFKECNWEFVFVRLANRISAVVEFD